MQNAAQAVNTTLEASAHDRSSYACHRVATNPRQRTTNVGSSRGVNQGNQGMTARSCGSVVLSCFCRALLTAHR